MREVISVCLQGHTSRPVLALPYAVVQAQLDPERDEVDYILKLITGDTPNPLAGIRTTEELGPILRLFSEPSAQDMNNLEFWNARIAVAPNDVDSYVGRAAFYGHAGRDSEAFADFERAISLDPRNATAYVERGLLFAVVGDLERAATDFTAALQNRVGLTEAHRHRGTCLARLGRLSEALADSDEVIRRGAGQAADYYSRGNVLLGLQRYEEAQRSYEQALELDPRDPLGHLNMGVFHFKRGAFREALPHFERAAALGAEDGEKHAFAVRQRLGTNTAALERLLKADSTRDVKQTVKEYPFMLGSGFLTMLKGLADSEEDRELKRSLEARIDVLESLAGSAGS